MTFYNIKATINAMNLSTMDKEKLLEAVKEDEATLKQPTKDEILSITDKEKQMQAIKENIHLFQ